MYNELTNDVRNIRKHLFLRINKEAEQLETGEQF